MSTQEKQSGVKTVTQVEKIIEYIKRYGSITPLDALKDIGCMRLASRMCDIKAMGYGIVSEIESSQNRDGEPVRYARYRFAEDTDGR